MTTVFINGEEIEENVVYNQGYVAAARGEIVTKNPHDPTSYEGSLWEDGWYDYQND